MPSDVPIALLQPDRLALVFRNGPETRQQRAEIEARVREPYQIDEVPLYVDFAFGAAEFPKHARTVEELLQKASIAMHTAVIRKRPYYLLRQRGRPHQPRQSAAARHDPRRARQQRIRDVASG